MALHNREHAREAREETGLKALWGSVVEQAFQDALYKGTNKDTLKEREAARRWLTTSSVDFLDVCDLAELDPDAIHQRACARIAACDASPKPKRKVARSRRHQSIIKDRNSPASRIAQRAKRIASTARSSAPASAFDGL